MTMPGTHPTMMGAVAGGGGGGGALASIAFVTSGTSTNKNVPIPASATAGDLAVVFDSAYSGGFSVGSVTPAGWSTADDQTDGSIARIKVNYKVLVAGDLGTSPAFSDATDRKIILIFRPTGVITSVINSTWNHEFTSGNPSAQTVTVSGLATPLIVLAVGGQVAGSAPAFTDSPSMTEVTCTGSLWSIRAGYIVYNSAPSDQSIDTADGGTMNALLSGFLRLT